LPAQAAAPTLPRFNTFDGRAPDTHSPRVSFRIHALKGFKVVGDNSAAQTVMVVDDSDDVRELIVLQLRLSGYEVFEAKNGQEAVEMARSSCPSLILMDINMPVLDGLAATRLLREVKEMCHTAIVAFSAFSSGDNRQLAIDAGCNEYVNKTESISHLLSIVERHLRPA